jgi:hypothetical protein
MTYQSQWLGSRAISAQKANTANAFNLGPGSNASASSLLGSWLRFRKAAKAP